MTPDQVKRANELLNASEGLVRLLMKLHDPDWECGQLALCADVCEAGCSHYAEVYLPKELTRTAAQAALDHCEQALADLNIADEEAAA